MLTFQVVQTRGAAVIKARKLSSAMSAAKAICDHMRTWWFGTPSGDYISMGVYSDGKKYNIPDGIFYSFPLEIDGNGDYTVVDHLEISQFSRDKMDTSAKELREESDIAMSFLQQ